MPLSAAQIDLLVSTGRISAETGNALKQQSLQTLDRGDGSAGGAQAAPVDPNLMGQQFGPGLTATPIGQQAPMFPELMGQPSAAPAPAPQPAATVTPQQLPDAPKAPAPAPPAIGARPPILPAGTLPAARSGLTPENEAWVRQQGKAALDGANSLLQGVSKATRVLNPLALGAGAIGDAAQPRIKAIGQDPNVKRNIAEAITTGDPNAAVNAVKSIGAANTNAATPAADVKAGGESDSVTDKQPMQDPAIQQALQQQAQQAAYQAAAAAYSKKLADWKTRMQANFDGYVGKAADGRMATYDARGKLLEDQGDETGKMIQMQGAVQFQQAQRDQEIEAKGRQDLENKLNEMDRISNELRNEKLDPNRWFSNKSTLQKIGLAIGGILASGAQRRNVLDKYIDQDLKLQLEQYNRQKDHLSTKRNLFSQYMELFGDKQKALAASRLAMKQFAQSQIDAQAATHAGQLGKNNAELAKGEIDAELEKERYKLWMMLNPAPAAPGMGAGGYNSLGKDELERMFQTPDGRAWLAPTGKSGEDFREMFGGVQALSAALDRAESIKAQNPKSWFVPGTEANNALKAIQYDMNAEAKRAAGKGENSDKDFAFRMQSIGDISSPNLLPGGGDHVTQARQFVAGRQRILSSQLNSSGSVGIVAGYGVNPKTGKTERIFQYKGTELRTGTGSGTPNNSGAPPVPGMTKNK